MVCVGTMFSVGFAAMVLVLHQYRFKRGTTYWLESAAALIAMCQAFVNVALLARVLFNTTSGFIVPVGWFPQRYAVFAAAVAAFVCLCAKKSPIKPGIIVTASFLTLPFMETWLGSMYPAVFVASVLILLASGIWLSLKIRGDLMTSISSMSLKQAMDSLDTAVLFYKRNGHILMQNTKMRELMIKTAGHVFFNGRLYLETIVIPNSESADADGLGGAGDAESIWLCRFPDGVWLFATAEVEGEVVRLTAMDVTEQDRAAATLKERHKELQVQRERLRVLVDNIEENCRAEELLRIKTGIHDAQNHKLIMLLQYLRYGELPKGTSFAELKASLLPSLRADADMEADPQATVDALAAQYERAGVKIHINGALPQDRETAAAFAQILMEAAANAVKHGYASEVYADITNGADGGHAAAISITDNSTLPPRQIREGSGIASMRRQAEKLGGTIEIQSLPRFTVTAQITPTPHIPQTT